MSKKIILFLSDLKKGEAREYRCPDGGTAAGVQTCEAPLRYLLGAYPKVSEVLCIVTPIGKETLPAVRQIVKEIAPATVVTPIPFEDGEDFSAGPLAQIMAAVKKNDEILLELTGGLRDAVMQLLLTSRALSFSGVPTTGAVYSNFGTKEIVDCAHLIGLFDLLGGMQELASFGSVRTLRSYYAKQSGTDPAIEALLSAMEGLTEDIALCRTGKIDQRIAEFNSAMDAVQNCSDPLMRALLPAFRAKFGKKLNIPGLIKWCLSSDMIQQALTIYRERIPVYVLNIRGNDLVKAIPRDRLPERRAEILAAVLSSRKDYETEEEVLFRWLLNLGNLMKYQYYDEGSGTWKVSPAILTLEYLEELAPSSDYFIVRCGIGKLKSILMDYQYIRMLRNMTNHAIDESTGSDLLEYLVDQGYPRPEETGSKELKQILLQALEHLK